MIPRLFVGGPLAQGGAVPLTEGQAHYLRAVLRCEVGQSLIVFDGMSGEFDARLGALTKRAAVAEVGVQRRPFQPSPDLWLVFAPIKKHRLDFLVEKAVELGAARLLPVITRRTDAPRLNGERLAAQIVEAAEQCERLDVPDCPAPQQLAALLATWPAERTLYVCAEAGPAQPFAAVLEARTQGPAAVLVGPEGGFTQEELEVLAAHPNCVCVGLGPRILRAETAAITALALWQAKCGDWRQPPPARD
jgi:16S rRNA (uracil1498-N3)-methyltransferase